MKTTDVINFMAKGAPGAMIVMSASDLKGFADEVVKSAAKEQPARRVRGLSATSEQAEIVQAIMEVWPETKITVLAKALGVSKMWIYKLIRVNLADMASVANAADDENETLSDVAKMLTPQE